MLADGFRSAMRRLAASVTVVATGKGSARCGITATAVTSLSVDPPSLLVCVNRGGALRGALAEGSSFCVNVLGSNHAQIGGAFAGGMPHDARFMVGDWEDAGGAPRLRDARCAVICEAAGFVDWATHTIVIGTVRDVRLGPAGPPLIYCDGAFRVAPAPC